MIFMLRSTKQVIVVDKWFSYSTTKGLEECKGAKAKAEGIN
jgi:hypothetical protein